ncbi:MAG: hypothetical protein M1832_004410 [Thelocarpon impressellum]|nr:MAG: hypothetical protein M1832_004410 [Thelocarpon impressellum]
MTSSVFFKFKSQKEPSRVTFDGTGISVFELKRAIIEINHLGDGTDFDLAIYNEDNNEEYDDDTSIIPRSTSIIARRLPPAKAGRGGAARYVSGKMPVNALNSHRMEKPSSKAISKPALPGKASDSKASDSRGAQSEEDRIAAMFQAGAEQWDKQQQEMANATPVFRSGASKSKPAIGAVPSHPPPTGYICYRCGEKGHWIQECPTNDDPNFDNRPRVKRTTGIPRSFLKTIEKPAALSNDGLTDTSNQPSGVMVNAEGEFVVAEPDKASWDQYQAKTKVSAAAQEAAKTGSKELQERGLECPIDKRLFVEPTKTPCCSRTYCNDCITNGLIESDLTCPGCQSDGILIDDLVPDEEVASKVKAYVDERDAVKHQKEGSRSPTEKAPSDGTGLAKANAKSPSPSTPSTPNASSAANGTSKKRPAEEEMDRHRIPKGPAAMRAQQNQVQQPGTGPGVNPQNMKALMGTPGLPGMPGMAGMAGMAGNGQAGFGSDMFNPAMGQMGFPSGSGYMGMPMSMGPMMGMDPKMMNPMMMNGFGPGGPGFGGMGGMAFPGQQNGMYGGGYGGGMMPNGAYGQPPPQMPMGNGGMGMGNGGNMQASNMNGVHPAMAANAGFANQQQTEDDNAYFRKPVNPHRHQARQRRMRPSDYHEL